MMGLEAVAGGLLYAAKIAGRNEVIVGQLGTGAGSAAPRAAAVAA